MNKPLLKGLRRASVFLLLFATLTPSFNATAQTQSTTASSSESSEQSTSSGANQTVTKSTTTTEETSTLASSQVSTETTTSSSTEKPQKQIQSRAAQVKAVTSATPLSDADFAADYGMKDAFNPFLYNVFASGYHSANAADTEGGLAIGKDSTIVKNPNGFTYGGYFDNAGEGVGDPLSNRERVALMIGGQINSYANPNSMPKIGNGLIIVPEKNKEAIYTWPNIQGHDTGQIGQVRYLPDSNFNQGLAAMTTEVKNYSTNLKNLSDETIAYENGAHEVADNIVNWPNYPKRSVVTMSAKDPSTLVIKVTPDSNGLAVLPQLNLADIDITSDQIKRVIFTTSAEKAIISGAVLGPDGSVLNIPHAQHDPNVLPYVQALAQKVVYNLPNAKQVTNFAYTNWQTIWQPDLTSETGEKADHTDAYGDDFIKAHPHPIEPSDVAGALVAPEANVLWTGVGLNGYVFVKNFHQRNGAEAHNFYYPSRPEFPEEEPDTFSAKLYKYVSGNKNSPLANAEFIFARKARGSDTYEYLEQISGRENWLKEAAVATRFKTGANGWLALNELEKVTDKQFDYYFKETKAPPGYQLINDWLPTKFDSGTSAYTAEVANKEVEVVTPIRLALKKTDDAGNPLNDAVFVLSKDNHEITATTANQTINGLKASYAVFEENLTPGTYQLYEKTPPKDYTFGKDGPTTDHPWTVIVTQDNQITIKNGNQELGYQKYFDTSSKINYALLSQAIVNQPEKLAISIAKVDEKYRPVAGVNFSLVDQTRSPNQTLKAASGGTGLATFSDVMIGHHYELSESGTIEGLGRWSETYTLILENDENQPIPMLMDQDGNHLKAGTDFFWNAKSHTLTFFVVNQIVPKMPATGGSGTRSLYLIASLFVLVSFAIYSELQKRMLR